MQHPIADTLTALATVLLSTSLLSACAAEGSVDIVLEREWADEALFLELAVATPQEAEGLTCDDFLSMPDNLHLDGKNLDGLEITQRYGLVLPTDELPDVGVLEGGTLLAARARDGACKLLGHGCVEVSLSSRSPSVRLTLTRPDVIPYALNPREGGQEPSECPQLYQCARGRAGECIFGDCQSDTDCDELDEWPISGRCRSSLCEYTLDADEDGLVVGLDCDDHDRNIPAFPTGPICGVARDHDCDGVIDDLDGCDVPACEGDQTYEIVDLWRPSVAGEPLAALPAYQVFVSGRRVVATHVGPASPTSLWVGSLGDDRSLSTDGELELGDERGYLPFDLVVVGERALVVHSSGVEVIDISDPSLPPEAHQGRLDSGGREDLYLFATFSAPTLLVRVVGSVLQFDASWIDLPSWPVLVNVVEIPSTGTFFEARLDRVFMTELESDALLCLTPDLGVVRECFNTSDTDATPSISGTLHAMAVAQGGVVFLAGARAGMAPGDSRQYLWRVRDSDGDGDYEADVLSEETVTEAVALGNTAPARSLTVVGDGPQGRLLLRATTDSTGQTPGVFLHRADRPDLYSRVDVDGLVRGVAVVGDVLLLATETEGLVTGHIRCSP